MDNKLAATKSNLIKLKEDLSFAKLGYELLDQKRSILVVELLTLIDHAVDYQSKVEYSLLQASQVLQETILHQGRLKTGNLAEAVNIQSDFILAERKVMGVHLPKVETNFEEHGPYFSPEGTTVLVEETIAKYRDALHLMGKLAELKVSIMRLAKEVKKTIRKTNSLEKIVIPSNERQLNIMKERIEETERENFILLKEVKEKLEAKAEKS